MKFLSGLPETECGAGSTLAATVNLRERLPVLLAGLGVRSLLDAPCGDCNWITQTDLSSLDAYFGLDFYAPHIEKAVDRVARMDRALLPTVMNVLQGDILHEAWPKCEAVLTRDFLQHWPHASLPLFVKRFDQSGATFLFATTFDSAANEDIRSAGGFNRLNTRIAPLNWGEPVEEIEDGDGHVVGLWHRSQIVRSEARAA